VPKSDPDIKEMSFETSLKELEGIVGKLEQGQIALEEAIVMYTRGTSLKEHCEKKLKEAKLKVEKVSA